MLLAYEYINMNPIRVATIPIYPLLFYIFRHKPGFYFESYPAWLPARGSPDAGS